MPHTYEWAVLRVVPRVERGEPKETIATRVSSVAERPIVSPCQATESRPSR